MITDKRINRTLSVLYRYNQRFFAHKVKERKLPIEVGHIPSLMQVYYHPGITQDQLSFYNGMDKGTTARSIKQLEELKLLYRKTDQSDRRINHLFLTPDGIRVRNQMSEIILELHEMLYEGFESEEIDLLMDLLQRMKQNSVNWHEAQKRQMKCRTTTNEKEEHTHAGRKDGA